MWIPGAFTATEVLAAWRAGASIVKLFPAGSVGPAYIKDLRGPLREIPLLPTGGVTIDNAGSFLEAGAWGLGMGSALVAPGIGLADLEARARRLRDVVNVHSEKAPAATARG
jgi:2-dehydro-3-deoxyphosphogluconate aldolase/(4S)-4-hydroxy-2-oxoglutarate aldolase